MEKKKSKKESESGVVIEGEVREQAQAEDVAGTEESAKQKVTITFTRLTLGGFRGVTVFNNREVQRTGPNKDEVRRGILDEIKGIREAQEPETTTEEIEV